MLGNPGTFQYVPVRACTCVYVLERARMPGTCARSRRYVPVRLRTFWYVRVRSGCIGAWLYALVRACGQT